MKNKLLFSLFMMLAYTSGYAFNPMSPLGRWITIDSHSHKPSGIVEITDHGGNLNGKIAAGFGVDPIQYCHHCPGKLNNTPVVGLTFLWDFVPDKNYTWTQGSILDPHTGKIYRGALMLIDGGKKLQLRGYWGIFFQTETWIRDKST
jgi:uncharacterized protein (DUF2147 family)